MNSKRSWGLLAAGVIGLASFVACIGVAPPSSPQQRGMGRRRRRRVPMLAGAVLAVLVGAGCVELGPSSPPPQSPPPPPLLSASPALFPEFSRDVVDYVIRCDASTPVQVAVDAPAGLTVSVDAQPAQGGSYSTQVTRDVGQEFTVVVQPVSGPWPLAKAAVSRPNRSPTSYYVRCLPSDFPPWTVQRPGTPQAEFFVTVIDKYSTIFDSNGVPVWWSPNNAAFADVLADGDVIWTKGGQPGLPGGTGGTGAEEHRLDGSLVQSMNTIVGNTYGDDHDVLVLPNGDYVMAAAVERPHVDLSSWTVNGQSAPSDATIVDYVLQEINPSTSPPTVVWSWDAYDHIPVTETPQEWWVTSTPSCCFQPYHWNSIEATSGGFVASFRHLDAVYKFDPSTSGGPIIWKLGGTTRPESLTVHNDPVFDNGGDFSGQHDARVLGDGSVTLHDNATKPGTPPRAVHYAIDTTSSPRTATLQAQLTDPLVPASPFEGSARLLAGGDWVIGWGGACCGNALTSTATELTGAGARVLLLQFSTVNGATPFLYRFLPVPSGVLAPDALRAGMNAQYP